MSKRARTVLRSHCAITTHTTSFLAAHRQTPHPPLRYVDVSYLLLCRINALRTLHVQRFIYLYMKHHSGKNFV